nr:hypothetical protein [Sphingomonas sp. CDS-1]
MSDGNALEADNRIMQLSRRYPRYALAVLFLLYAFNLLDRQVVNILAEPIKRDLQLADWQLGSLAGLSFALCYATLALPIARVGERGDRVNVIAFPRSYGASSRRYAASPRAWRSFSWRG